MLIKIDDHALTEKNKFRLSIYKTYKSNYVSRVMASIENHVKSNLCESVLFRFRPIESNYKNLSCSQFKIKTRKMN